MDITVQELRQKLQAGEKFVFIDVREPWEFQEFNLGGQLIPIGDLMTRSWELKDHLNDEIVLYCRSGARSGMGQALMQAQGFSNVRNLIGGVVAWKEAFGNSQP